MTNKWQFKDEHFVFNCDVEQSICNARVTEDDLEKWSTEVWRDNDLFFLIPNLVRVSKGPRNSLVVRINVI